MDLNCGTRRPHSSRLGMRSSLETSRWTLLLPFLAGSLLASADEVSSPVNLPDGPPAPLEAGVGAPVTKPGMGNRPYRPQLGDVRPSSFEDVTPGRTHVDQMIKQLGDPIDRRRNDVRTMYIYRTGPFEKVEIVVVEDLVSSITLRLIEPTGLGRLRLNLGWIFSLPRLSTTNTVSS